MTPLSQYAAIALMAASLGSAGAWQVQTWRYTAKDAAHLEAQAELARNNRKAAQVASEGLEDDRTKTEVKYRTITREVARIVDRPVYNNLCFDNSGVQLLRQAIGTASHPGEPQDAVPEPR